MPDTPSRGPVDYTGLEESVASIMRSRTRDDGGDEDGAFTTETRPTLAQVTEIIDLSVDYVKAKVGDNLVDQLHGLARSAAAYRTAHLVELSYWPEQIEQEHSPAEHYRVLFDEAIEALTAGSRDVDVTVSPRIGMVDTTPDWFPTS